MRKEQLPLVYSFASCIWPSFKLPKGELQEQMLDVLWYMTLKDFDLDVVLAAIQNYAISNNFCNIVQIGELCKKFTQMSSGTFIDEEQTISHIQAAVSWNNCKENFEKLTPFEKEIVQGPHRLAQWSADPAFNSVIVSNLRKTIRNKLDFQKQQEIVQSINIQNEHLKIEGIQIKEVGYMPKSEE